MPVRGRSRAAAWLLAAMIPLVAPSGTGAEALRSAGAGTPSSSPPHPFEVGAPFPEIPLPSAAGRPLSLARFRGRKTILHIFASW